MFLYRSLGCFPRKDLEDPSLVYLLSNEGVIEGCIKGGVFHIFICDRPRKSYLIDGTIYFLDSKESELTLESFQSGTSCLVDCDDNPIDLEPKIQYFITYGEYREISREFIFFKHNISWRDQKICSASIKSNELKCVDQKSSFGAEVGGRYVAYEKAKNSIFCLDKDLKKIWNVSLGKKFKKDFSLFRFPAECGDGFVVDCGAVSVERSSYIRLGGIEEFVDKYVASSFRRYSLATGRLAWELEVEGEIQQYQILEKVIYLCTNNLIMKISADKGEILQSIDTGLSDVFGRLDYGNSLYVVGDYIFYGHSYDRKFMIYSAKDLSVVRDVSMPEEWHIAPKNRPYYHESTEKLYFQTRAFKRGWVKQAVMEIDVNRIDEPVEVEQGPDFTIELIPSQTEAGKTEVLVTSSDPNFDEVLRFAEIHVRDEAFEHGVSMMGSHSYTEGFNGVVNFRYLAESISTPDVKSKLKIMENRFDKWADTYQMFSADNTSTPCRLVTNR